MSLKWRSLATPGHGYSQTAARSRSARQPVRFFLGGSTVNKDVEHVTSLIFGRWRSQVLYVGAALGLFDRLDTEHRRTAEDVAKECGFDGTLLYRLMRALGAVNLLDESDSGGFRL